MGVGTPGTDAVVVADAQIVELQANGNRWVADIHVRVG